jgi:hypothetical protein
MKMDGGINMLVPLTIGTILVPILVLGGVIAFLISQIADKIEALGLFMQQLDHLEQLSKSLDRIAMNTLTKEELELRELRAKLAQAPVRDEDKWVEQVQEVEQRLQMDAGLL